MSVNISQNRLVCSYSRIQAYQTKICCLSMREGGYSISDWLKNQCQNQLLAIFSTIQFPKEKQSYGMKMQRFFN